MRTLPILVVLALLSPVLVQAQAAPAPAPSPGAAPPPPTAAPAPAAPPEAFPQSSQAPAPAPAPMPQAPPAPAPYGYGYGYGYPPPALDPARAKAVADLQAVDTRLAALRREQAQYSLAGPIAMTAAGFGVASFFGAWAIVQWAIAEDIQHRDCAYYYDDWDNDYDSWCDVNNDGRVDSDDRDKAQNMARGFGITAGVVSGVGIAGAVLLAKALGKRRVFQPEIQELNLRRRNIMQQLRYGGGYSHNGGLQLTISGRF